MAFFISTWTKFFVLLTPFFALSMFLLFTSHLSYKERRQLAIRVTGAVLFLSLALFFAGQSIFDLVGITIDSFRVGAGALLFLSAVSLVHGDDERKSTGSEVAVVPLAIPIIVGPATTGGILIMGAEVHSSIQRILSLSALITAIICIGLILLSANSIERLIKRRGIVILSKLTGLILAALSSQMIVEGVRHLWKPSLQ